ncbi:unnamed protein product, partial [Sphagnum tenellum]
LPFPDNIFPAFAFSTFVKGDNLFELGPEDVQATELYADLEFTTFSSVLDTIMNTVCSLCHALCFNPNIWCLATPSLAQAYFVQDPEQVVSLLDIDRRFSYLPGFQYWDIWHPEPLADHSCKTNFRVVVFDPPFFYIPMEELHHAVLEVCKGDTKTWLLIGFLVREEWNLLNTFKEFKLMKTKFVLEYTTVKPNKWRNYTLYSNVDLPGIKRIQK